MLCLDVSLWQVQGSAVQKASDTALGIALCLHSHIHINSVLSDYVPKSVLGEAGPLHKQANACYSMPRSMLCHIAGGTRAGALAVTGISILGITRLNLAGPGLTPTIKKLWHTPTPQQ